MDESKLTISEQVMLGIYKANAGNQLDGELAFMRSKAPFGNYAPKTRHEIQAELDAAEAEGLADEQEFGVICVRYEQPSIFGRIWGMFYCGLWYSLWFFIPIAAVVACFWHTPDEKAIAIGLVVGAGVGIIRGFFRRKAIYLRSKSQQAA